MKDRKKLEKRNELFNLDYDNMSRGEYEHYRKRVLVSAFFRIIVGIVGLIILIILMITTNWS